MRVLSLRSFWLPVLLTTLVAAFFGALLARRGRDWNELLAQKAALKAELADLLEENARLRSQRDQLLSSPEAIERVAREEYGFAAPGERIEPVHARPVARAAAPRPRAPGRFAWLTWERVPILLTLSVFAVTAFVFAVLNAMSAEGADEE